MRVAWHSPFARWTLAFVVLHLIDAIQTWFGLRMGAVEGVPLYHVLYSRYPFALGVTIKMAAVLLVCAYVALTRRRWPAWGALLEMRLLTGCTALLVLWNAVSLAISAR